MKKGSLICIMGIDGSGKTTLSNLFIEKMKQSNKRWDYVWCKFGNNGSLLRKILSKLSFLILEKNTKNSDFQGKKPIKKNTLSLFYMYFLLLFHYFEILTKIKFPILFHKNIICDRYLADTIVDLCLEFGCSYDYAVKLVNKFIFVPKPDVQFYISVPVKIAYERKKENSKDYLKSKEETYNKYVNKNQIILLNGEKNLEELLQDIINHMSW